jgi:hypothetical protein
VIAPVAIAAPSAPAAAPARAAPRVPFGEVLQRALAPSGASRPHAPRPEAGGLRGVEEARARLDRALAESRSGRTFSAQELLALQADAYRYQHAVEIASRVAEAGAQTVRQAVNTQV